MTAGGNGAVMTGGEAIVAALAANGVDTVFGLPGAQTYPVFDALQQRQGSMRLVGARHEQSCGYMAFGYARSTGRPGVFSVVPGPGVLNATAALATGLGCCTPMLCITGQVPSAFLGRGRGHLHEIPDQLGTLRGVTKWGARIERPADAPALVNEAFRQMLSGRPGPVVLEMAWDAMAAREYVEPAEAAVVPPVPAPIAAEVEAAAALLLAAKRPMIFTGSGAQHAAAEVLALAEALDAPVTAFRGGRGVVAEDHELGLSSYAAYLAWPQVDAAIGIGTRLELPMMRWTGMMRLIDQPVAPPHIIRIDIDPAEMRRLRPHAGIVADARAGTQALLDAVQRRRRPRGDRGFIATARQQAAAAIAGVQPQLDYLAAIRAALPRDGFFVTELCQSGFASYFAWPALMPYTYVSEGYQGTLGYGFPAALGVKVAHPGRAVVSVTGDGGFQFALAELATAKQEGIGLVTVLFNNNAFGNVLRDQQQRFDGRLVASALDNPDFLALAAAYGVAAERVDSPIALRPALDRAIAAGQPALIEVALPRGGETSPWPFIHPG